MLHKLFSLANLPTSIAIASETSCIRSRFGYTRPSSSSCLVTFFDKASAATKKNSSVICLMLNATQAKPTPGKM
jgi:hypothetical protein